MPNNDPFYTILYLHCSTVPQYKDNIVPIYRRLVFYSRSFLASCDKSHKEITFVVINIIYYRKRKGNCYNYANA